MQDFCSAPMVLLYVHACLSGKLTNGALNVISFNSLFLLLTLISRLIRTPMSYAYTAECAPW